jgi:hypothetical protein
LILDEGSISEGKIPRTACRHHAETDGSARSDVPNGHDDPHGVNEGFEVQFSDDAQFLKPIVNINMVTE